MATTKVTYRYSHACANTALTATSVCRHPCVCMCVYSLCTSCVMCTHQHACVYTLCTGTLMCSMLCTVCVPPELCVHIHLSVCTHCVQKDIVCTVHTVVFTWRQTEYPVYSLCTAYTVHVQKSCVYSTHFSPRFLMSCSGRSRNLHSLYT